MQPKESYLIYRSYGMWCNENYRNAFFVPSPRPCCTRAPKFLGNCNGTGNNKNDVYRHHARYSPRRTIPSRQSMSIAKLAVAFRSVDFDWFNATVASFAVTI